MKNSSRQDRQKLREPLDLIEILEDKALTNPDSLAFLFLEDGENESAHLTYKELSRRAKAIASFLQSEQLQGKKALICFPSGLDYISTFFGCVYSSVISIPAFPPTQNKNLKRLESILENSQAEIIFAPSSLQNEFQEMAKKGNSPFQNLKWIASDQIGIEVAEKWEKPNVSPTDLVYLQYTSGSTGSPKGVLVNHKNLLVNLEAFDQRYGHEADNAMVSWVPMFHDMGMVWGILSPLYSQFPCYIMPPSAFLQKPVRWLKAISRYRATHSGAPNFAYNLCLRKIEQADCEGLALESWKIALDAAEPVSAETLQRFAKKFESYGFSFNSFCPAYGLAEATLLVNTIPKEKTTFLFSVQKKAFEQNQIIEYSSDSNEKEVVLVGHGNGATDTEILIVNPTTCVSCVEEQLGEIWVSGTTVSEGYYENEQATKEVFHAFLANGDGPYLRTGDLGFFKDKELFITGRLKELIIIRGTNHYPHDIEETAETCDSALRPGRSIAFSVLENGEEEQLILVLELKSTQITHQSEKIGQQIYQKILEKHEIEVSKIIFVSNGTLLKTSSGKKQRKICRQLFLSGKFKTQEIWIPLKESTKGTTSAFELKQQRKKTATEWLEKLQKKVALILEIPFSQIEKTVPLQNYGLDSLATIQFSEEITQLWEKPFSPAMLYNYPTLESLTHFLAEKEVVKEKVKGLVENKEPIAIIGMACRFPGAATVEEFFHLLKEGKSGICEIPPDRWNLEELEELTEKQRKTILQGGFLKNIDLFDASFFGISPREAPNIDPQQRLLIELVWEVFENAALLPSDWRGRSAGVFIGACQSDYFRLQSEEIENLNSYSGIGSELSILANRISYLFDFKGPSLHLNTACSSSLVAVHQACQSLLQNESEIAIAGGVHLNLIPDWSLIFEQAGMLSSKGRCNTFDEETDGYVRGEGGGILLLKKLSEAQKAGDPILATIMGTAINQDGQSSGITAPNGISQTQVIEKTLNIAGVSPSDLGYIEAHGTGTLLGDPVEINALKQLFFNESKSQKEKESLVTKETCWVGSVKTNIGHLEPVSGVAGIIKVVLSLSSHLIFPHLHFKKLNPEISLKDCPLDIPLTQIPWESKQKNRIAGVNSFGFGGTNAHSILKEFPVQELKVPSGKKRSFSLLTLSAKTPKTLKQLLKKYIEFLSASDELNSKNLENICFTSNVGRTHFPHRLFFVAKTKEELLSKLEENFNAFENKSSQATIQNKITFLFSGQGSQYPNMGKELYQTEPLFQEWLDKADQILEKEQKIPLTKILFNQEYQSLLQETEYTQPVLFALEYALAQLWISWGVQPNFLLGHSVGEYVAACVAEVFSFEDGLKLVLKRGELLQKLPKNGSMIQIGCSEIEAQNLIAPHLDTVSIAAINAPKQIVISGLNSSLQEILKKAKKNKFPTLPLLVSHAFHSLLLEPIRSEFKELLATISFSPPKIPILSNITGKEEHSFSAQYWEKHLFQPVRFAFGIEQLQKEPNILFLEVGPKPILSSLGKHSWPEERKETLWLSSLKSPATDTQVMLHTLGTLYLKGVSLNWKIVHQKKTFQRVRLPHYPFQRKRYWSGAPLNRRKSEGVSIKKKNGFLPLSYEVPFSEKKYFQVVIEDAPFLKDHLVYGKAILPGTVFLEILNNVAKELANEKKFQLENLSFHAVVPLDVFPRDLHILIEKKSEERYFAQICLQEEDGLTKKWKVCSSANLIWKEFSTKPSFTKKMDRLKEELLSTASIEEFYEKHKQKGLSFGESFQNVQQLWHGPKEVLAFIKQKDSLSSQFKDFTLNPTVLDSCLHILRNCTSFPEEEGYLLAEIGKISIHRPLSQELWSYATIKELKSAENKVIMDCCVLNIDEEIVLTLDDVVLQKYSTTPSQINSNWLYELEFVQKENKEDFQATQIIKNETKNWILLTYEKEERFFQTLQEKNQQVHLLKLGAPLFSENQYVINSQKFTKETLGNFFQNLEDPKKELEILYFAKETSENHAAFNEEEATEESVSFLKLIQVFLQSLKYKWKFTLITRGAQGEERTRSGIFQAPLWGMLQSIEEENPHLFWRRIDLDPSCLFPEEKMLQEEFWSTDLENQVLFRDQQRKVPRLSLFSKSKMTSVVKENENFSLKMGQLGQLDSLQFGKSFRREPEPNEIEIEIKATGLNFRDVLTALGQLEPLLLGCECSGVVTRVGKAVKHFQEGDFIVALVRETFKKYLCVPAIQVIPMPKGMSFEAGASLPVNFITAYYALKEVLHISEKDTILIHAISGGTGLAAAQIAKEAGARIIGTASPSKWDYLKSIGITTLFNSRNTDFAQKIKETIAVEGVSIVFNSLADDFIPKSLALLKPNGYFIELGKNQIWSQEKVSNEYPTIQYHPVSLIEVLEKNPQKIQEIFQQLRQKFNEKTYWTLPLKVFSFEKITAGFRFMQQAKHIGKIVFQNDSHYASKKEIRDDRCYLVTGGLGGIGLEIANWIMAQGGKHLILLSRQGKETSRAKEALQRLKKDGVQIEIAQADVAKKEEMAPLFKQLKQKDSLPLGGIFHSAGVLEDHPILLQTKDSLEKVFAPKVAGTWNLHLLSEEMNLDFFVLFSSAASLIGSAGQSNYSGANAFLDAVAFYRKSLGKPTLVINWGPWGEVGMVVNNQLTERIQKGMEIQLITPSQGISYLEHFLKEFPTQVGVIPLNWKAYFAQKRKVLPFFQKLQVDSAKENVQKSSLTNIIETLANGTSKEEQELLLQDYLKRKLGKILGYEKDELPLTVPLNSLGFDSLMAVEFRHILEEDLHVFLDISEILSIASFSSFVPVLLQKWTNKHHFSLEKNLQQDIFKETTGIKEAKNASVKKIEQAKNLTFLPLKKEGQGNPLFFIHGLGSGMFSRYKNLASHLSLERPMYYVFGSWDQEPIDDYSSFDQIVKKELQVIKTLQPKGPYSFIGYCLGGNIAYAITQELQKQNEEVQYLGVIDSFTKNIHKKIWQWYPTDYYRFARNFIHKFMLKKTFLNKHQHFQNEIEDDFRSNLEKEGKLTPAEIEAFAKWNLEIWETHQKMWWSNQDYAYYDGKVTLFCTPTKPIRYGYSLDLGWGKTSSEVEIWNVQGTHQNIMKDPKFLTPFALKLQESIKATL